MQARNGMTRLAAGLALPLLQLLLQAIDPAVELIDTLPILLRLTRSSLSLGERLAGRAFDSPQPPIDAVNPRVDGGDLLPDETLRGATT